MSDESSRSARPYGQRRNDGAPTWWAALDRADLPDNEVLPAAHRRWYEDAEPVTPALEIAGRSEPARARRGWLIGLLVVAAIALLLCIAWAADTIACNPEPHSRFNVSAGASFVTPAFIAATRAMYMSFGSVWITLPNTT